MPGSISVLKFKNYFSTFKKAGVKETGKPLA